ncbi:unnamed protein product [Paramecium octaurelia]|uniref:Uncharacterized protein n=1 Tax=Paramecium octaurelia TaxID=43137 RepID=A0A8S1W6R5_PAROT|nr:unnamed protein product [Paramecium octaurelia]
MKNFGMKNKQLMTANIKMVKKLVIGIHYIKENKCKKILFKVFQIFKTVSGGGMYEGGNKFGKWIELDQRFYHENQVIYNCEYKNGQKFGRWNTKYMITSSDAFLLMQKIFLKNAFINIQVVADHIAKEVIV